MGMSFKSVDDMPPGMRRLYEKQMNGAKEPPPLPDMEKLKTRKYRNSPTERTLPSGAVYVFDSKKEAAYYDTLKALETAGIVRNIRMQVQFLLQGAYTVAETGERIRAISYLADFTFEKKDEKGNWRTHTVDVKGRKTKEYIMKKKLMAELGVYIEEV